MVFACASQAAEQMSSFCPGPLDSCHLPSTRALTFLLSSAPAQTPQHHGYMVPPKRSRSPQHSHCSWQVLSCVCAIFACPPPEGLHPSPLLCAKGRKLQWGIQDSVQALGTARMHPGISGDGLVFLGAAFTSAGQALGHGGCEGGEEDGKEEVVKKGEEQGEVERRTEEGGAPGFVSGWLADGCRGARFLYTPLHYSPRVSATAPSSALWPRLCDRAQCSVR